MPSRCRARSSHQAHLPCARRGQGEAARPSGLGGLIVDAPAYPAQLHSTAICHEVPIVPSVTSEATLVGPRLLTSSAHTYRELPALGRVLREQRLARPIGDPEHVRPVVQRGGGLVRRWPRTAVKNRPWSLRRRRSAVRACGRSQRRGSVARNLHDACERQRGQHLRSMSRVSRGRLTAWQGTGRRLTSRDDGLPPQRGLV